MLIDDWRDAWRFWSLRFNSLGLLLLMIGEQILPLLNMVPGQVQAILPRWLWVGLSIACFVLGGVSRIIRQRKLDRAQAR